MFRRHTSAHRLLILAAVASAASAWACSVPVFRYALEHWMADPFQGVLFHRGPLTAEQQAAAYDLGSTGLAGRLSANVFFHDVDLDKNPGAEWLELFQQSGAGVPPWLVMKFPAGSPREGIAWAGPLNTDNVGQLLESPARKQITQRLSDGQSAVWLLIESGDTAKDAAAAEVLDTRLKYLASVLQLPKLDAQDIANGLVSVGQDGLRLEFSSLRLSRDDPQEQAFVTMLLNTEADLAEIRSPIVLPIFGQGRALYALVGDGIKRETIDQAAMFLIGKCSCQVKEQNPGIDLLVAADWKSLVKAQAATIPDLPTMTELVSAAPETVTISGDVDSGDRTGTPQSIGMWAAIVVVALVGAGMLFRRLR